MWRSRRYRSEWFTPWRMLTTTRWTRDRHPLHRWSTSGKMTSSFLIDVEGDTASQHMSRRQVSIQTTSTVVRAIAGTTSTVAAQDWWLDYCLYTQSFSGRCMYHNSVTPPLACIGDTRSPTPCLHMVSRCSWWSEPSGSETSHRWSRFLRRILGTRRAWSQCSRQKDVFGREVCWITGDGDDVIIDWCRLLLISHGGWYSFQRPMCKMVVVL